jgi:sugar lactone lactonase YvrE
MVMLPSPEARPRGRVLFSILIFGYREQGATGGDGVEPASELDVVAEGLAFPESPRWRHGELWIAEKRGGRVITLSGGGVRVVVEVPGQPGGLGWTPDGDLLVVAASNRQLLRLQDGELVVVADLTSLTVGRCNDMVVDRHGRAYVGHFGYDLLAGALPADASLVLVDPDGTARSVADDLAFPNGCVLSPEADRLVVAESGANRLTSFAVAEDGSLGDRQSFAELGDVVPDGIALDAEGAVWVADPVGGALVRVLAGGQVTDRISTEPHGAFACALGGDDGRTLFACLYTEAASTSADAPAIGKVVRTRVAVPAAA